MNIPYVIDNQTYRLVDVLSELLAGHAGKSLDVATAYFTVGAFGMLREGLGTLGNFRLLLGAEPHTGEQIGLRPEARALAARIRGDIEREPFSEATLRLIEDLIRFLRKDRVAVRLFEEGFLHAKCYLFYNDSPALGWDRFQPVAGIVGGGRRSETHLLRSSLLVAIVRCSRPAFSIRAERPRAATCSRGGGTGRA